ncbi:MAG: hypothetical protein Tsb002_19470 [Wenzhouxiangellaceae bacterium]
MQGINRQTGGEALVDESYRWIRLALEQARQEADEALQSMRMRERVCRAELRDLCVELTRSARQGLETVTLEVQIQRRLDESMLCRQQADAMRQHLSVLRSQMDRNAQLAAVN